MAKDPELGYKMVATVIDFKGQCSVDPKVGESFKISCHNPAGRCGFFYHSIFPSLQTFQFDANMPWWQGETILLHCPDSYNQQLSRNDSRNKIESYRKIKLNDKRTNYTFLGSYNRKGLN